MAVTPVAHVEVRIPPELHARGKALGINMAGAMRRGLELTVERAERTAAAPGHDTRHAGVHQH